MGINFIRGTGYKLNCFKELGRENIMTLNPNNLLALALDGRNSGRA